MKKEQGFSLIELLIVVAIIAIIAAIAVPSMLTARMAANESGAVQGCRTIGSAEMSYAAVNSQTFAELQTLVDDDYLDERFDSANNGFNGYFYAAGDVAASTAFSATIAGFVATPQTVDSTGRYVYGIGADQAVRYLDTPGTATVPMCGAEACIAGDPVGLTKN